MQNFDLAIVGSGIAASMTISQLATRLQNTASPARSLRIAVIERDAELWCGVPYGRRSSPGALTFQRLQEFLEEPDRSTFIAWLVAHAANWKSTLQQCGGAGATRWLADNQQWMDSNQWQELYIPRFLFGQYVSTQTNYAIAELSRARLATITRFCAEATGITCNNNKVHAITLRQSSGTQTRVLANRVVLAVGSPPQSVLYESQDVPEQIHTHIRDLYFPSEEASLHLLRQRLSSLPDKQHANLLVIGSNASALEVLYLIHFRPELRDRINSVTVLSYSGSLPSRISAADAHFELTALDALTQRACFSAADLMRAITQDIRRAEQLQQNVADLRDPVSAAVGRLTARMPLLEQERFVCEHGASYSRLMRRAGPDTCNAAEALLHSGLLRTLKGRFLRLEPHPDGAGLMSAVYACPETNAEVTHPVPFAISINCAGFEQLDLCSSPLLNSLIENRLCAVNRTRRGFLVSDSLEASKDFFVIGPLLAGNFNNKVRLWHAESASRISTLASLLADSLMRSLASENNASTLRNVPVERPIRHHAPIAAPASFPSE